MKLLPVATVAGLAALLYKSPGARSWFGSLLIILGQDVLDTLPDVDLDDEARERMRERIMTEIRAERIMTAIAAVEAGRCQNGREYRP